MVLLEKVIEGLGVSKVLDSDDPNFKPGDIVSGLTRWEEYSLIYNHEHLRKVESDNMPLSYYTGLLGMNFLLHLFLHSVVDRNIVFLSLLFPVPHKNGFMV